MRKLKDICASGSLLGEGLMENGGLHKNYKLYTSMEQALGILMSGYIYIPDGKKWNDISDRNLMTGRGTFAKCFSCSVRENIAMWMLYGGQNGKKGAMLNFYPFVMKELRSSKAITLGKFDEFGKFQECKELYAEKHDYEIFLTDVIYTDPCKNKTSKIQLTLGDEHITVDEEILNDPSVYYKNFAWKYEQECRLVIKLKEKWRLLANDEKMNQVRIALTKKSLSKMGEDRLIRSPIFSGKVEYGEKSQLTGNVDWDL